MEKKRGTEQHYLTVKRIKIRYRDPNDLSYFNHPFEIGNKIRLLDDFDLESSISEISLATDFDGVDLSSKKGKRNATEREVINDSSGDLFDFTSSIGKRKTG